VSGKHTPGPWKEADYIIWPANGGDAQFPVHARKRGRIALALTKQADARLISAAPELLEALQGLLAEAHSASKRLHEMSVWSQRARAAIEKATGSAE
jgi:hypothetical protein